MPSQFLFCLELQTKVLLNVLLLLIALQIQKKAVDCWLSPDEIEWEVLEKKEIAWKTWNIVL